MPECRFCLVDEKIGNTDNPLLSPCKCKGSAEFVHVECLEKWRSTDTTSKQHYICPVCNTKYNSDLVLFKEIVPDLQRSFTIKLMLNPLIIPLLINYLYLCLVSESTSIMLCNMKKNETNYICQYDKGIEYAYNTEYFYIYYYALQILHTSVYTGLYCALFSNVESKRRYLRHSLKFIYLPLFHLINISFIQRYMILSGTIHQFLMPFYIKRHIDILKSMNDKL